MAQRFALCLLCMMACSETDPRTGGPELDREVEYRVCGEPVRMVCEQGVVRWRESCGELGEVVETCASPAHCIDEGEAARCDQQCIPGLRGNCLAHERCELREGERRCIAVCPPGWVVLEPGKFEMGTPEGEVGRMEVLDLPQREVTLTHTTCMAESELSQRDFEGLMGFNPSHFSLCEECPVESLSWDEAAQYANARSLAEGFELCYLCDELLCESVEDPYACRGYRLPTEAEWEYAARAGTSSATYAGELAEVRHCSGCGCWQEVVGPVLEDIAWWVGNAELRSHPPKQLSPNAWGLYDMLGNVGEFCHDGWEGADIAETLDPWAPMRWASVVRGCAWSEEAFYCRAGARRQTYGLDWRTGFRLVRSIE